MTVLKVALNNPQTNPNLIGNEMKTVFYSELESKIDGMRNLEADSAELSQSLIEKDTVLQASFTSLDITTIFVVNITINIPWII